MVLEALTGAPVGLSTLERPAPGRVPHAFDAVGLDSVAELLY